jgi:hypothetical protein
MGVGTRFLAHKARTIISIPVVSLAILIWPTTSFSQYNLIAIFGDTAHSNCVVVDNSGLYIFRVFHYSTSGTLGSRFRAPYQVCLAEYEFIQETHPFPGTTGNSQVGVSIPYGSCLTGWTHILTIFYYDYTGLGSPPCCQYPVLPYPSSSTGGIEILNCESSWIPVEGQSAIVNGDSSCPCSVATGIAAQVNTWGAVKALYFGD